MRRHPPHHLSPARASYRAVRECDGKTARLQVDEIDEHTAAIGCRDGEPQADNGI
jgi:hypothetical protein